MTARASGLRVTLPFLVFTWAAAFAPSTVHTLDEDKTHAAVDPQTMAMCHIEDESTPTTNLSGEFCTDGNCFPAIWLLGAQKAGTTAVYDLLQTCGLTVGAWPSLEAIGKTVPTFCMQPCKETHFFETMYENHFNKFIASNHLKEQPSWEESGVDSVQLAADFTSLFSSSADACAARSFSETPFPSRARAACDHAAFVEASPSTELAFMPEALAHIMPEKLLVKARFVMILREPVERALSWYNHNRCPDQVQYGAPFQPCAAHDRSKSFDEYISCRQESAAQQFLATGDAGNYAKFVDNLIDKTPVSRKQLLVLNYANAFANASTTQQAMRIITAHYGLPVLDNVTEVSESNSNQYGGKVERISCAARDRLHALYEPMRTSLYTRFDNDYTLNRAPKDEPNFGRFELKVLCEDSEMTSDDVATMLGREANGPL